MNLRRFVTYAVTVAALSQALPAQERGSITGVVLDAVSGDRGNRDVRLFK